MRRLTGVFIFLIVAMAASSVLAYNVIPAKNSGIKYFYIFGPAGEAELGSEADHELTFYIDLPEEGKEDLRILIFDPDTGGRRDYKSNYQDPWDTTTEFSTYGEEGKLLDKRQFSEDRSYDRKYFQFGPYPKNKGEKIGNKYRFRLNAKVISGNEANLFNLKIFPDNAEVFTYKLTFRLSEKEGQKMYFYPEINPGMTQLIIENYDIDIDGGTSRLYDPQNKKYYPVNDSLSGDWAQTIIPVSALQSKRLQYVITKKTQRHANAGLQFKDDQGNPVPIYFEYIQPQAVTLQKEEIGTLPCNTFTFDGTKSYAHSNKALSYNWDFGDGITSNEPIVTHVFEKSGDYPVKLTVRDDSGLRCDNAVTTEIVSVNAPPQPEFTFPERICIGQEAVFDASATQDNTPEKLTYRWSFCDGTSAQGKQVTKAFPYGGSCKVTLSVNDNSGTSCNLSTLSKTVKVNTPPAIGKYKDIDLCIPADQDYKVTFDFMGIGEAKKEDKLFYHWDFGDGTNAQGKNITHIYQKGGKYTAKLKVDDGSGLPCSSAYGTVNVSLNKQPFANAGGDIITCIGNTVNFDAAGSITEDNAPLTYTWDFGDGSIKAQGAQVSHSYKKPGTYQAKLTVDDGKNTKCSVASDSLNVYVNSGPNIKILKVNSECTGKPINFDASKSSDPDGEYLKFTWDFGDGTVSEGRSNITHTYEKGGEYLMKVTADDQRNTSCSKSSTTLKIKINTPPIANTGPNLVCCTNVKSEFNGSNSYDLDGDALNYHWDFGDGSTSKEAKTTHVYTKKGSYKVMLKVNDNSGTSCSSSTSSFTASVHERPVSVINVR